MADEDQSAEPEGAALQIDEISSLRELGETLARLARDLRDVSDLAIAQRRADYLAELDRIGADLSDEDEARLQQDRAEDFRRVLIGLRSFRRDYEYWERVIVEFALARMNLTQREVATRLGVGLSTINRWAQHPLTVREYR